ncbi:MAG: hypothetical protein ACRD0W_05920 [Acidimicrobiales bacterium]
METWESRMGRNMVVKSYSLPQELVEAIEGQIAPQMSKIKAADASGISRRLVSERLKNPEGWLPPLVKEARRRNGWPE